MTDHRTDEKNIDEPRPNAKDFMRSWRGSGAVARVTAMASILAVVVSFVAALGTIVFGFLQYSQLRHQVDQMKAAGEQTDKLIATATKTTNETHELAVQAKAQADATGQLADRTLEQATIAARQARPWMAPDYLCVDDRQLTAYTKGGYEDCGPNTPVLHLNQQTPAQFRWWVTFIKTGNNPALNSTMKVTWCLGDVNGYVPSFSECVVRNPEKKYWEGPRYAVVLGNREPGVAGMVHLTANEVTDIISVPPKKRFYLIGRIDYVEQPSSKHWTNFCGYYSPQGNWHFQACESGNRTDSDK